MSKPAQPLPRALFDKMIAAKNFQSGLQTLRQVEFSLFDLRLHTTSCRAANRPCCSCSRKCATKSPWCPPEWNRFPQSFSHIFAGGYAAGYYSYKWAEVLSADAFEAFEEAANGPAPCSTRNRPNASGTKFSRWAARARA
jgi:oligopeptidase A